MFCVVLFFMPKMLSFSLSLQKLEERKINKPCFELSVFVYLRQNVYQIGKLFTILVFLLSIRGTFRNPMSSSILVITYIMQGRKKNAGLIARCK